MRRLRNYLTQLIFVVLVLVSGVAAIQVIRQGIPANTRTNHWAVRKILSPEFVDQSREAKLALARDLEREFNRGVDIGEQVAQLDAAGWKRFETNFGDLMEIWFLDKVDHYDGMKDEGRKHRYLEMQIGRIKSWPVFERNGTEHASSQDKDRLERLTEYLLARYRRMPAVQQQRIQRFLVAVWLQNSQLSQFIPGVF